MLTKFLEGVGGKLGERWMTTLFTPAFSFWFGGIIASIWNNGLGVDRWWEGGIGALIGDFFGRRDGWHSNLAPLVNWIVAQQDQRVQVVLLVTSILGITMSAVVVMSFDLSVLRFLEGYWPRYMQKIQDLLTQQQYKRFKNAEKRWQALAAKGVEKLTRKQRTEYIELDWQVMNTHSY
jgi:hypothetical protein